MQLQDLILDHSLSRKLLEGLILRFARETELAPVMSAEIEFCFLSDEAETKFPEISESIKYIADNNGLQISDITKEVGENQFEVNFVHHDDLIKVAEDIVKLEEIITKAAEDFQIKTSFAAKPYDNKGVGSGMHIHLSLRSKNGENMFAKLGPENDELMEYSIAGILNNLRSSFIFYLGSSDDFARFIPRYEMSQKEMRHKCNTTNAPINVSWGGNNRTTAIRIPDFHKEPKERHIEFRVPSSDANPYLVIAALLFGILEGLSEKQPPIPRTYGNAFDSQYNLSPFPKNLEEALEHYEGSRVQNYVDEFFMKEV